MRRSVAVAALLLFGCSSSSGSTSTDDSGVGAQDSFVDETPVADSTTDETSPETSVDSTPSDGEAGACNDVAVPEVVAEMGVVGAAPAMTGGTVIDGSWKMTKSEKYGVATAGPDGVTLGQRIVVSGTSMQSVATAFGAVARWNASFSTGGTDLALKETCGPSPLPTLYSYSASPTQLQLYVEPQQILETFTLE